MTEETQTTQQQPDAAAIETRAREMGWRPQEEFRGSADKWVDAKTFLENGEKVLPIVRAENRRLHEQFSALQAKSQSLEAELAASRESIEGLKAFHKETAIAALKAQRRQLRGELIEARKEGNAERELEIQDQLDELDDQAQQATTEAGKPPANGNGNGSVTPPGDDPTQRPEFRQFMQENPWFQENPVMRAASLAIMQQLTSEGKLANLSPAQRFSMVAAETRKAFRMEEPNPSHSKVESTTGPTGSGGGGRSYQDLPADAKQACDRFEKRMVGPGKAFKDSAEWRKHYVQNYDWS